MKAQEIMTESPACCTPRDTVERAAKLMAEHDCGCLPVVSDMDAREIVGVVTDRDLACRCLGEGKGAETEVSEVMSASPSCCTPESDVDEVERIMAEHQVRRVPVVDDSGCCVGMIAQADLARADAESNREVRRTVERISEPTEAPRSDAEVGVRPGQSRGGCC
jgi:CBS domain-containing protein